MTKEVANAGGLTDIFEYESSVFASGTNSWSVKTTVTRNDGSQQVVYSNYLTQVMLKILRASESSSSSSGAGVMDWFEAYTYDSDGRPLLAAATSDAVAGYAESTPGLFTLNPSSGLIRANTWYTSGVGQGWIMGTQVLQGASGSPVNLTASTSMCSISTGVIR